MRKRILLAVAILSSALSVQAFVHPCLLHTQTDIDYVKGNLDLSPWTEAYTHLKSSSYAQSSYTENTSALLDGYLKRMDKGNWGKVYDDYNNYSSLMKDANAAYQLALRYALGGDTDCADAAVTILNAWATNCKGFLTITGKSYANDIPDPNEYLMEIQGHQLANAAELLRDYSGWSASDFDAFKTWISSTFADVAYLFLTNHHGNQGKNHYWLNWDLASMTSLLSIAVLCDDQEKVDFVIDYFKNTTTEVGCISRAVPFVYSDSDTGETLGQCEESGRDQGHSTLCVALLGVFCQTALNIGEDLFAYDDYRALAMAEYVAKYNLMTSSAFSNYKNTETSETESDYQYATSSMPYTSYTHESTVCTSLSISGRGTRRPCWELFAGYAAANGVGAVYSTAMAEMQRDYNGYGDGGAGDYGNNSGGFDQLGYGTLMYYRADNADNSGSSRNDTYVRNDNAKAVYGTSNVMELKRYTNSDDSNGGDFYYGLISFTLPSEVVSGEKTVEKATLRLITRSAQAKMPVDIYEYESQFAESTASYTTESDHISAALQGSPVASFTVKAGNTQKALSDSGQSTSFYTLDNWVNEIDLTDYVKAFGAEVITLMLYPQSDQNESVKVFTKEATDISGVTDKSGNSYDFAAADLVPQLILETTTNGVEETLAPVRNDGRIYNLQGMRVQAISQPGIYIINGRKVCVK